MLIKEYIDDSAKSFIAIAYIKAKYTLKDFMKPKYRSLTGKIADIAETDNTEAFGNIIAVSVICLEKLNLSEQTVLECVKNNTLYSVFYDHIKDTDTVKEIINQSEIIHITIDPVTGEHKPVT